jgi:hypothetical protein
MDELNYYKASEPDVRTLVEYRILFALELSKERDVEKMAMLKKQMTTYFTMATRDNSCISFIARCGNEVAGIGSVHMREMPGNLKNPSGRWGYIMNMYTVPKYRRKGICKTILNLLVEEGQKWGATAFELHATNTGELVYRQNGFVIHPEPTYRKFIFEQNVK